MKIVPFIKTNLQKLKPPNVLLAWSLQLVSCLRYRRVAAFPFPQIFSFYYLCLSLLGYCFRLDCEQSLSSPNFSEVGELASEARAASREKRGRFYPYFA